jgi:hypothetical protein
MSDAEELARKKRRRQLIERLNQKEEMLGREHSTRRAQMTEEELEAEIEMEREQNYSRRGFGQIYVGGGGDGGGGG